MLAAFLRPISMQTKYDKGRDHSGTANRTVASIIALLFACLASRAALAKPQLTVVPPAAVGMRGNQLAYIDQVVEHGLEHKRMPGCVVTIGRRGSIVFQKAYGFRQLEPSKVAMTIDTVFDMASITKPVATATSVMILLERGQIRLRDRVASYIPEFRQQNKKQVTVFQLLTHQAGFVPDNALADYRDGREQAFKNIYQLSHSYEPGTKFVYSDVGFILLGDLIQRQGGKRLDRFADDNIFTPLRMSETGYLPSDELRARAAVTEKRDGEWIQGEVHDPRAHLMEGVAGHAGLFSTADDLAVFAQMLLNGGQFRGTRILARPTVELMTKSYTISYGDRESLRGLGWDKLSGYSSNRGENFSSRAFGHGGFTGTVLWVDPDLELFVIFLSNRVHPDGSGSVNSLAGRICTIAAGAIDERLGAPTETSFVQSAQPIEEPSAETLSTGLDELRRRDFDLLHGQRIGLITNQTGIDSRGTSNVRLLAESSKVDLRLLFSPEHGLEGKLDVPRIGDTRDDTTRLPVYSLYGKTRKPTNEQLDGIDTLVFDIQDIGCRFYTYISTMGLAMQAAAENGKRFIVLDRPNPINGNNVAGPVLDVGRESFVAFHRMPVRHGMTVGELARMFKTELDLNLDLRIVKLRGWKREDFFDQTGLLWVNPSPNMRNLNQALLYPGIGLLETTNLSVGRGTDTPFEVFGAPWLDGQQLARNLREARIDGVQFTPRYFTPTGSVFQGQRCGGVQISITNRSELAPLRLGLEIAVALRRTYPSQWQLDRYLRLLGNANTLKAIKNGQPVDDVIAEYEKELASFRRRRRAYLLY